MITALVRLRGEGADNSLGFIEGVGWKMLIALARFRLKGGI